MVECAVLCYSGGGGRFDLCLARGMCVICLMFYCALSSDVSLSGPVAPFFYESDKTPSQGKRIIGARFKQKFILVFI